MTPDQKRQLEATQKDADRSGVIRAQEKQRLARELRARGDAEALASLRAQERADALSLTMEAEAPLLKALDKRQLVRLEQIQLQGEGPMAFTRPEIQRRLNLSPGQVELITAIIAQGREAMSQAASVDKNLLSGERRLSSEDRKKLLESEEVRRAVKEKRASLLKIRQSTIQAIAKQLTKTQRANYLKMLGEPFDFSKTWPGQPTDSSSADEQRKSAQ